MSKKCKACGADNHPRRLKCVGCDAPFGAKVAVAVVPAAVRPAHEVCISNLITEIREMEGLILYYQNRILKKQIALTEILESLH